MKTSSTTSSPSIAPFLRDKHIAIVGGGPGGLTLACLLQRRGAHVTVYERDASPTTRVQGSSLDLHPDTGQAAIDAAELRDAFQTAARPEGERHMILDKTGRVRLNMPTLKLFAKRPEIDRADLRDLLLAGLRPGTIMSDRHCIGLAAASTSSGRILLFSDGSEAHADLVIACDGARSKLRRFVTDIEPVYSGITLIQGEVANPAQQCPQVHAWVNKGNLFALGDGKGVLGQEKGDGNLVVYVTTRQPEDWATHTQIDFANRGAVRQWVTTLLPDWNPIFHDLVLAAMPLTPRPLYGTPDDQRWETQPDLTLIGDAAHVMPPFAGQGANMAMRDALDLANALSDASHPDLHSALVAYERGMLERTGHAQRVTRGSEELFHAPDALDQLLRRLLGPLRPFAPVVPFAVRGFNALTSWIR